MQPPIRSLESAQPVRIDGLAPDILLNALRYGDQVAVMKHDQPGLLHLLHYKLYQSARIRKRASWPGGGVLNWIFGEGERDYIHCSGSHLIQILGLIGFDPPQGISRMGQYALHIDWAQPAYDRLRAEMGLEPYRF